MSRVGGCGENAASKTIRGPSPYPIGVNSYQICSKSYDNKAHVREIAGAVTASTTRLLLIAIDPDLLLNASVANACGAKAFQRGAPQHLLNADNRRYPYGESVAANGSGLDHQTMRITNGLVLLPQLWKARCLNPGTSAIFCLTCWISHAVPRRSAGNG